MAPDRTRPGHEDHQDPAPAPGQPNPGEHSVTSQAELVKLLAEQGVDATQVTVSRDLEEIGALKVRGRRGSWSTPCPVAPRTGHARAAPAPGAGEWVADVTSSANLVIIRTPPGCAHVVASALDRAGLAEIAGTVAGDDTVLVIAAERVKGSSRWPAGLADMAGRDR